MLGILLLRCAYRMQKMTLNVVTIENYETAMVGLEAHHEFNQKYLEKAFPQAKLPAPVKLKLNSHSIVDIQKAILDTYGYDEPNSVFQQMKVQHDGKSKLSQL